MKRAALLGPGTFSEEAARFFLGEDSYEFVPYRIISDVFRATESGQTDLSVVPIENTIEGSVHLDWLVHEVDLPILAEWVYPIVMNLIGAPPGRPDSAGSGAAGGGEAAAGEAGGEAAGGSGGGRGDNPGGTDAVSGEGEADTGGDAVGRDSASIPGLPPIDRLVSYPVAISQCQQFIRKHLPKAEYVEVGSTAEGARYVRDHPGQGLAAIGTAASAKLYGLEVLAPGIQDHANNFTRFVLVGKEAPALPESPTRKTTILVTLPEDFPGALHQVLSAFAWRRINLSKIESRPTKKKLGSYYFYIDIEESMESVLLPAALAEIQALGCQVRILGSYPSYTYEQIANSEV